MHDPSFTPPDGFEAALEQLRQGEVTRRIWERDHTVWRPEPEEIADRLGWLDLPSTMQPRADALEELATQLRRDGTTDVVLVGMGGSSLGAEALWRSFGPRQGFSRLHTLDSTVAAEVAAVAAATEPAATLHLIASKSGTTAEVRALLDFFWQRAESTLPAPGRQFLAVTDPGTPLAAVAEQRRFREILLAPADVGGRFSVLSPFGLTAAALVGIDVGELLRRARAAREACGPERPVEGSPAARLGAFLGAAANGGRDKLTLLCSPAIAAFGLWIEQLVAESTGKEGKGLLPVTDEPPLPAADYRDDRAFVALRLEGDDNTALDERLQDLRAAGRPRLEIPLAERADLGGQFFVWELATAIAGHLLGVQPFDQPDVQAAKDRTRTLLAEYERHGSLPQPEAAGDLDAELARERPEYVAVLAYLPASPALEGAVTRLRRTILSRCATATTFAYGPRYLHSTGQLHKGGPPGGLFLQLVPAEPVEVPIAGRSYGFATLAAAQASGDLLALQERGRRCLLFPLADDAATAVDAIAGSLDSPRS